MGNHLERILEGVREDLATRKAGAPMDGLLRRAASRGPARDLLSSLPEGPGVIAEIKRASPSRGWIRQGLDAPQAARNYLAGGAWGISVLTEGRQFGGSLDDLESVRAACPESILLRKDFILDEYMLAESRAHGADLVLLMVGVLGERTGEMVLLARRHALEPLVEVHNEGEMETAAKSEARLVGINNRDLSTLSVDLATSERLLTRMPPGAIAVVESGISDAAQVRRLHALGGRLFLVGESLVASADPADTIRRFVGK
ncbi:MAG TPA: indole-3-glycerol phosphate synthase TrpC [Candidatus Deferrimicrobiaceae bacterium]